MPHLKYVLASSFFLFMTRCSDDYRDNTDPDCVAVACTQNFVTIFITVEDPSGVKIPLDSIAVTDTDTGEDLTLDISLQEFQMFREQGQYPLYDDSYKAGHRNMERLVTFTGFIDAMAVVSGNYVVAADCCHVRLVSGDQLLILEQNSQP
jgi:hypothetical protein